LDLHGLRASRPSHGWDDLPPLLDLAAAVVHAMYLMTSTRCGITAKQLERELGVHYKTAWRMFNKIRNELMKGDEWPLKGEVEVDETSWGGRPRRKMNYSEASKHREAKPTILGMIERGGRIRLRVIAGRRGEPLSGAVRAMSIPERSSSPTTGGLIRALAASTRAIA
jgi:hypothetical protein